MILEKLDRVHAEHASWRGSVVTITPDMTDEEAEMEIFAGFLKEGYPAEKASRKSKRWLALARGKTHTQVTRS